MSNAPTAQYEAEFIEHNRIIKLDENAREVTVGVETGGVDRAEALERLSRYHGKPIVVRNIDPKEIAVFLGSRFQGQGDAGANLSRPGRSGYSLDRPDREGPTINLVNSLILNALRSRASDVHIESYGDDAVVRNRVDGELRLAGRLSADRAERAISRVKVMAKLNIMERRAPQEGRCRVTIGEEIVDIRVSTVPIAGGESVVLRLLSESVRYTDPSTLGFSTQMARALKSVTRAGHGLYLFTGPTGSGKTTTLHSVLRSMDTGKRKVITIEDPVEYTLPGIPQVQANAGAGLTFDALLARVLRQDPNVIMIGEIRDRATAQSAVRAALSGHLILSTLHTDRAVDSVERLVDIGVPRYLLRSVLRSVFTQRLVRRVCPACRRLVRPSARELSLFARSGLHPQLIPFAVGCDACGGSGYTGRFGIGEFIVPYQAQISTTSSAPPVSIEFDGLRRVAGGSTSLPEVLRETAQ